MQRRSIGYGMVMTMIVIFVGAAGMHAFKNASAGFTS